MVNILIRDPYNRIRILMTSYLKFPKGIIRIPVIFGFSTLFPYRNHQKILYILKVWVEVNKPVWAPDYNNNKYKGLQVLFVNSPSILGVTCMFGKY